MSRSEPSARRIGRRRKVDIFPADGRGERLARVAFFDGTSPKKLEQHLATVLAYRTGGEVSDVRLREMRTGQWQCARKILEASKTWPDTVAAQYTAPSSCSPNHPDFKRALLRVAHDISTSDIRHANHLLDSTKLLEIGRTSDALERAFLVNIRFVCQVASVACSTCVAGGTYDSSNAWSYVLPLLWVGGVLGTYAVGCTLYFSAHERICEASEDTWTQAPPQPKQLLDEEQPREESCLRRPSVWDLARASPGYATAVAITACSAMAAVLLNAWQHQHHNDDDGDDDGGSS